MSDASERQLRAVVTDRPGAAGEGGFASGGTQRAPAGSIDGRSTRPAYAGLVTRAIAFAVDAALIDAAALVVAAIVALALSVLHLPTGVVHVAEAIGGAAFALWTIGYFVTFWATTGQTPGNRLMEIRVRDAGGGEGLLPRRALVRFVGLVLSAIPLFAGFLPVLLDDRRRGFHDRLARTVVVHAPPGPGGAKRA